jgi:hypothetical protein
LWAQFGIAKRRGPLTVTADRAHRLEPAAFDQVPLTQKVRDRAMKFLASPKSGSNELQLGVTCAVAWKTGAALWK